MRIKIRFLGTLNDFLRYNQRNRRFAHCVDGRPAVMDTLESLGVPHTEIGRIQVGTRIVQSTYHLQNGDAITVWPIRARKTKIRPKFILDVHLGKLARLLRMLGFDVLYQNQYADHDIVAIAESQKRIVLTRDIGLLKHKKIRRGYWLRETDPRKQLREVLVRFALKSRVRPFSLCLECNGKLKRVGKESVLNKLPLRTRQYFRKFYRCNQCGRIYWPGSHYANMKAFIEREVGHRIV